MVLESQAVESHHQISKVEFYVLMFASGSRCNNKEEKRMGYASCVACCNTKPPITSSIYQDTRILSNYDYVCGCVEIKNAAEAFMSPNSRRLMTSFFAFFLLVRDYKRYGGLHACEADRASQKSTSLRCGMRIKSPFLSFGFLLLTTLPNYQDTKTKFTSSHVCRRAEIGKGSKSSPCCCSHALQISPFYFALVNLPPKIR